MKSGVVTLIGRPNSGKSTLLNALVRQKVSIVSPSPQTTRHRIRGILTEPRGQVVFVDTPGVHRPEYGMNRRMQRSVQDALRDIDLLLLLVDGSIAFGAGEGYVLDLVTRATLPTFLLINKIDKIAKPKLLPLMRRYAEACNFLEIIPLSALTGDNRELLLDRIFAHLPEGRPLYDAEQVTDRSERFLAAEFIREKVLAFAREEVPYATAVIVRKFDESRRESRRLVVVEADILVEKKSQQGIIIGKEGVQLRDLGSAARREIEELLGCKLFLSLNVRTEPKWRNNEAVLDELEVGT
ncbi:MAG: GTPase Era [Acidobacteria bacterium]|jgi:GTP-binding protein Era|nr:GTPase Era [Acidobacteriota bacterium]